MQTYELYKKIFRSTEARNPKIWGSVSHDDLNFLYSSLDGRKTNLSRIPLDQAPY